MQDWVEFFASAIHVETIVRLFSAIGLGAIIGWEREKHDKPAGLRTHILVSLGASVVMIAAIEYANQKNIESDALRVDPIRAVAGIIGGVGFLGAGCILQSRGSVQGVTTAASIWITAAIGTCCGMGLIGLAFTSGATVIFVLVVLGFCEHRLMGTKDPESPIEFPQR